MPVTPFDAARRRPARVDRRVLAAISAGGSAGALARYGLGLALPHLAVTFAINVSGCLLIGVLMVLVTDVWPGHRLLRPFLGTGVLGGYTTFSTYAVDVLHSGAAGYAVGTPLAALAAVYTGITITRLGVRRRTKESR